MTNFRGAVLLFSIAFLGGIWTLLEFSETSVAALAETRSPSAVTRLYKSTEVFENDFTVYADLKGNALKIGGQKVLTRDLGDIELLAVESGVEKSGSKKYVSINARVPDGKRYHLYVHHSGTIASIRGLLSDLNVADSLPWGDPLLIEAYQKNLATRRPWFDSVKHFFDPNSKLAREIIAGISLPRDLGEQEEYYYLVDNENPVAVLSEGGQDTGERLNPGTVVIITLMRRYSFQGDKVGYAKTEGFLSPIVKFRTAPNFYGEVVSQGYLHIASLAQAIQPLEDLKKLTATYDRYVPALRQMYAKDDASLTIEKALQQFHNSICMTEGRGQQALLKKWEKFIESKSGARARQIALNAQHVDIVARTIIGESQNEAHLFDPESLQVLKKQVFHPSAVRCQQDIIALSIRNRAVTKRMKSFEHRYVGDFTGAAASEQYNVWFESQIPEANYRSTSCFLSTNEEYLAIRRKNDTAYNNVRRKFAALAARMPVPLGMTMDPGAPAPTSPDYLAKIFLANPDQHLSKEDGLAALASFRHYYHPNNNAMKKGDTQDAIQDSRYGYVKSGFVRIAYWTSENANKTVFYTVTDGKLTRFDKEKKPTTYPLRVKMQDQTESPYGPGSVRLPVYKFEILVAKKWTDPNVYFKEDGFIDIDARLMEYGLEGSMAAANKPKAVLPNALFPQCFEKDGYISEAALKNGVRVPLNWFSKEERNEAARAFNHLLAGKKEALEQFMGGAYYAVDKPSNDGVTLYSDGGLPITIRCLDSSYYAPELASRREGLPQFGGRCDPNITLVRGL